MKKKIACVLLLITLVAFVAACGDKEEEQIFYSPGDAFVTNVKDAPGKLLKVVVNITTTSDETEMLTEKNAVVRNCILHILRTKDEAFLADPGSQQMLSEEIIAQLNELFPQGDAPWPLFRQVLFMEYVMQ